MSPTLTRRFNCVFFWTLTLSFLSQILDPLKSDLGKVVFRAGSNELGFGALRLPVIALESQPLLSGAPHA